MQLSALDWFAFAAVVGAPLAIGVYFYRRAGRNLQQFFLSGRDLPWWLSGTSMVATTFAADTPLAVTGIVAISGIAGNWIWWNAALGTMLTRNRPDTTTPAVQRRRAVLSYSTLVISGMATVLGFPPLLAATSEFSLRSKMTSSLSFWPCAEVHLRAQQALGGTGRQERPRRATRYERVSFWA